MISNGNKYSWANKYSTVHLLKYWMCGQRNFEYYAIKNEINSVVAERNDSERYLDFQHCIA